MRSWFRALGAAGCVAIVIVAGCGGNVVFENSGTGGSGGSGGASSTTTGTTTTTTWTTTGTTTGTTTTWTTTTGTTTTWTTTTGTTTGTTSTAVCDNTGDCGSDLMSGCLGCAVGGPCADSFDACVNSTDCLDFSNCLDTCGGDQACVDQCIAANPQGLELYQAFVLCVLCDACFNDCGGASASCP